MTAPDPPQRLTDAAAERVADTMFALSTPSRLQILAHLRAGPSTVSEIVEAVGMEQSAVSHQLRVLRDHSLLSMRRIGRRREYALRDGHVAALLNDALAHVEALTHGTAGGVAGGSPVAAVGGPIAAVGGAVGAVARDDLDDDADGPGEGAVAAAG
jgi:ArsR family transcriptional regulator, nickel/cobalt-responsive transcriptional repressor